MLKWICFVNPKSRPKANYVELAFSFVLFFEAHEALSKVRARYRIPAFIAEENGSAKS